MKNLFLGKVGRKKEKGKEGEKDTYLFAKGGVLIACLSPSPQKNTKRIFHEKTFIAPFDLPNKLTSSESYLFLFSFPRT